MNIRQPRLRAVAAAIEKNPASFDMSVINHDCGTPACIVGYTLALEGYQGPANVHGAQAWLELTDADAQALFSPDNETDGWTFSPEPGEKQITSQHAVQCLRKFAVHNTVDWDASEPKRKWND